MTGRLSLSVFFTAAIFFLRYAMKCKKCKGKLEILRMCRKVLMQCKGCGEKYQIHEVANQLDKETEEMLSRYTSIIYD